MFIISRKDQIITIDESNQNRPVITNDNSNQNRQVIANDDNMQIITNDNTYIINKQIFINDDNKNLLNIGRNNNNKNLII